ncbi:MAG: FdrA family protein [Armatimonadota bacterium]
MTKTDPKTTKTAIKLLNPNLVFISVPGEYAVYEASTALEENCNVMMASSNITLDDEVNLKKKAVQKGLLLMGPDASTALINGKGIGFSNVVKRGSIGIVGACSAAIQSAAVIVDKEGLGVSHAISTGSRDMSAAVAGIMTEYAVNILSEDDGTKLIIVLAKYVNKVAADKLMDYLGTLRKQFVVCFTGFSTEKEIPKNVVITKTVDQAALYACALVKRERLELVSLKTEKNERMINKYIEEELVKFHPTAKYLRALYSGGSFANEAVSILKDDVNDLYSNFKGAKSLPDIRKSYCNTVIDMGDYDILKEDIHPIVDYSKRCERILKETEEESTAVILLDVVLGYNACSNPAEFLAPTIKKAKEFLKDRGRNITFIVYICGSDKDVQKFSEQKEAFEASGAIVMPTNASAVKLASGILQKLKERKPALAI